MGIAIRFWIAVMIFLSTYVTFSTRVNISLSLVAMVTSSVKETPECLRDKESDNPNATTKVKPAANYGPRYDWDQILQGQIIASYYFGYVALSLPAGMLVEGMGPTHTLFCSHVIQAIANALCVVGAWYHYSLLMACRFVVGACGALVYPALQSIIARWAPPAEKGKFVAALMGNTLGICLTWPIAGAITQSYGWDWGFYYLSIQMGLYCILVLLVMSDGPETHPWISKEEKDYIIESQGGSFKKKPVPPYIDIFKSLPFWALIILHFGNMWGIYLQASGIPKFLAEVIGFDIKKSGFLAAVPSLVRLFCGLGFGMLGDYLRKKNVSAKFIRKFFVLFSHIIPGISLFFPTLMGCNWPFVVTLLVFSLAINGAAVLTNLLNPQDLSPTFASGLYGIMSFFGGMSGIATPEIVGWLTEDHNGMKEWGINFAIGGVIYIVTGIFFILFGSVERQPWNEKKENTDN